MTQALTQDVRLVYTKTVYIVPNGDDKETRQFEEKIPNSWDGLSRAEDQRQQ